MIYRALNLWKKKFEKRSEDQQFMDLALLFFGGKYKWGAENMEHVDCSGLISAILTLMGYPIRTTADEFMTKFFTKETTFDFDPNTVKVVFFVAKESYSSPSGNRLAGLARHISVLVGNGVVLHAVPPVVKFEKLKTAQNRYDTSNMIVREIDWEVIKNDKGKYAYDPELQTGR